MTIDPVRLARELVDIPSVTGEEHHIAIAIEKILVGMGFEVIRQVVELDRVNLLAHASPSPRVILSSHLDTVPPYIGASEDDDYLYGRGACDTKGIIAAMVAAASELIATGRKDFGLLFVVGEETDSIGAKKANDELSRFASQFLIDGEPTESRFVSATKGALTALVQFEGVAGHSAYPDRGVSAIHRMAEAIVAIHSRDWGESPGLGRTTVNVGVVRGGEKPNVIAPFAECELIFRTAGDPESVRGALASLVAEFHGHLVSSHGNSPVLMAVPEGADASPAAFNSDVAHLSRFGTPILFGPGSILDAHRPDENILKREIISAVETYRDLVSGLLDGTIRLNRLDVAG